jgi:hypothetical protein
MLLNIISSSKRLEKLTKLDYMFFQANLIFASEAGAFPSGALYDAPSQVYGFQVLWDRLD